MQPISLLRITANSDRWLSSIDQTVLTNVFHTYENTCVIAQNTTLKSFPVVAHTSMHGFVNEMSSEFEVSISYIRMVPHFHKLTIDDKVRLIKNHIGTIIHINEPLMHPVAPTNLILTWNNLFGLEITKELLKRHRIIEQYMVDPIVLKIILIILVLSSGNSRNTNEIDMDVICDDTLSIFAAQNVFVELLWKYILSRSANERSAVKFFNRLMMYILYTQSLHLRIDDYVNSLKQEIQKMKPIMQNMWPKEDNEEIIDDMTIAQDVTL